MNLQVYWIWLQEALGYGNSKILTVIKLYNSIYDFYNCGERDYRLCGCFTSKEIQRLCNKNIDKANEIIDKCQKNGYEIITYDSIKYPQRLKEIYNPPCVLYVWGNFNDIDNTFAIAIVGTRNATQYGLKNAFEFAYNLSKEGVTIISGGALGIDSASHKGVLKAMGSTVCVLGCGIDYKYLSENLTMRKQITEKGAVISEYPPGTPPLSRNFPLRNRIISGLSLGTLVIEAGEKSGSLITANIALEQNREVFALLGSVDNSKSVGTNYLIKNSLAKPVTNFQDILDEFNTDYIRDIIGQNNLMNNYLMFMDINESEKKDLSYNLNNNKNKEKDKEDNIDLSEFSDEIKKVYSCIREQPIHIDEIAYMSNLSVSIVLQAVTELEIYGLINALSGRRYCRS